MLVGAMSDESIVASETVASVAVGESGTLEASGFIIWTEKAVDCCSSPGSRKISAELDDFTLSCMLREGEPDHGRPLPHATASAGVVARTASTSS